MAAAHSIVNALNGNLYMYDVPGEGSGNHLPDHALREVENVDGDRVEGEDNIRHSNAGTITRQVSHAELLDAARLLAAAKLQQFNHP